ncbi:MAG: ribonuclease P protein component [Verrucomicrobiae bacterium]|nr:ribonuclease P protein component [Verrucomicrobiae bacterium]
MPAPSGRRWSLGRRHRLRAGGEFARLKSEGRRRVQGCLILNWMPAESFGSTEDRVGLVAGRSVGGAVIRNRAKRLMREAFRRHRPELRRPITAVLVARKSIVGRTYRDVEHDLLTALRQSRLLASEPAGDSGSPSAPESAA